MNSFVLYLQEELEFKRMFVRYITHEVRTPMNTAIMGLDLLMEVYTKHKNEDDLKTVQDIKKSCDIAANVLNELLMFDKLESGTLLIEKIEIDVLNLIQEAVYLFQIQVFIIILLHDIRLTDYIDNVQAKKLGVNLRVTYDGENLDEILEDYHLLADYNKLNQIMRNLISNGLKFTPKGGTVHVVTKIIENITSRNNNSLDKNKQKEYMLCIDVIDSGVGISLVL